MARKQRHTAQPHRSSPFSVDVIKLGRRPGAMFPLTGTVASPSHIGLDLNGVEAGAPLDLDLRVESVSEGVLVTGTLSAPITGECSRCLTAFGERIEVALTELFAYPDSVTEATTDEDEVGRVVNDMVDLEQPIIDAIGLELPFSPVCRADCPGLCPNCGVPLASAEPGHHHDDIDPRWSKLAALLPPDGDGAANE